MSVIRISAVGPLFRTGGFELSSAWTEIDLDKLTEAQIETLRSRVGRWIKVAPGDEKELEAFLEHVAELEAAKSPTTPTTPTLTASKAVKTARKDG